MLQLLTRYMFQYRKVCIPHIGTFEVVQSSPEYNVADKQITAPVFHIVHSSEDLLTDHQLNYLANSSEGGKETVKNELDFFGKRMKATVAKHSFAWKGIGNLSGSNFINFKGETVNVSGLNTIHAEKVMRGNAGHNMLVGEREMTTQQITDVLSKSYKKKINTALIGWIILALAAIVIILLLFRNDFSPLSTGLQLKTR